MANMAYNLDADLPGIMNLMRNHLEIRNRSWMKRVHKNCFLGSDAVDFLVTQGLVDNKEDAIKICNRMISKKLIRHVGDSSSFKDSYTYYTFVDDDADSAILGKTNAGNGDGTYLGKGGCKFSFAPHTAHNSYVLNIALAEELERAVAGASVEARILTVSKIRQKVREQAAPEAPDWILEQSTEVNKNPVNVYYRKRPRGDFKNTKMTGVIGASPKEVIRGIINFDRRKQWEEMFEDGVIVEAIDLNETNPPLFQDIATNEDGGYNLDPDDILAGIPEPRPPPVRIPNLPPQAYNLEGPPQAPLARVTDDVTAFLQTVDLSGIPSGMPIGFLNDPERQHALGHLRNQMLQASPQECMICDAPFQSSADYRFCPCCATIACASCVSKRVFEVVSRQIVSVCVHCYKESSRIRHPPEAVKDNSAISESAKGKWWRLDELGISEQKLSTTPQLYRQQSDDTVLPDSGGMYDALVETAETAASANDDSTQNNDDNVDPGNSMFVPHEEEPSTGGDNNGTTTTNEEKETETGIPKKARCKRCGELILRDVESIEKHMDDCPALNHEQDRRSVVTEGPSKTLGGLVRRPELDKCGTRIIYHTARSSSKLFRPREVCAFQDSFVDKDGSCYVYEISVRHCDARGIPGYATAEVLLLLHAAHPIKGNKEACTITIISQVDSRSNAPKWMTALTEDNIAAPSKMDLVRELKNSGNLKNFLAQGDASADDNENKVSLNDFELLAVLGRGGFGKVMQVKHKESGSIYAMKILKKSELQRRRQVERTKTERTILAAVKHPFIVHLYFAFQNNQKLYMVMDFVQGGDFFTLMRKYRRLPEEWVLIYISEVAMALQHLHEMDIVYRDLKPENILLCGDGHLKLTDFGLSRYFETRPPAAEDIIGGEDAVTRSFCGTEQYMSPEMLLQQGHNWRMDWWCLGLLMHEMLTARHPFHGPSHYDTLRNMVTKQPVIDGRVSANAATIIRGLLVKNPRARLCCRSGIDELKALPFFSTINWEALYNKQVPAPHVPQVADVTDTSFFENTFTREAPVDSISENPKAKRGKEGGFMAMFGMGSSKKKENLGDAPFAGFSFAKDYSLDEK